MFRSYLDLGFSVYLILKIGLGLWVSGRKTRNVRDYFLAGDRLPWVAAPISVVFPLGVLWKRATARATTFILLFGFPYTWLVQSVLFKHVVWLMPSTIGRIGPSWLGLLVRSSWG